MGLLILDNSQIIIIIFFVFVVINILSFTLFFIDKKRAVRGKYRISEGSLLTISLLFGALGSYLGMQIFSHKTKKAKFQLGLPLLIFLNLIVLYYLMSGLFF